MTPEGQNAVIGNACGLRNLRASRPWEWWDTPPRIRLVATTAEGEVVEFPDYAHDLNAMHAAEEVLDDEQWLEYMLYLCDGCNQHSDLGKWTLTRVLMHATATQRAEAFLRTIGKWEEEQ